MKSKIHDIVALDIGSSKISALLANIQSDGNPKIVSKILSASNGIRSSMIIDSQAAEHSIVEAIYNLEKEASINVTQVIASLSGTGTVSHYSLKKIKIHSDIVTEDDIKKLIYQAITEFDEPEHEIIHYFPIEYILDNSEEIKNPLGMVGKELGCRLHIITCESSVLLNMASFMARHQIEVTNFNLAIYASGLASLTEDEKNLGCMHIEIGARTTSIGIYMNGHLIYTNHVPVGGAHITSDIARAFSISTTAAEKLKILYGCALSSPHDKNKIINYRDIENDNSEPYMGTITIGDLSYVINSRVEEIFELVSSKINNLDISNIISKKLILTGGTSKLRNIKEFVNEFFSLQSRVAEPHKLKNQDYSNSLFSVAVGMIESFALQKQKLDNIAKGISNKSVFQKIYSWLKENV